MNALREEALREREAHLRFLVEQMPVTLWSTDSELRLTSALGTDLAALNLQPGQVVGLSLFEYFHTDDPEFPPIAVHRRALGGEALTYEQDWRGRSYQVHVQPLRSSQGAVIGCLGVALDVTARKLAEEVPGRADVQLERWVAERTAEFLQANAVLQEHLRERQRAEDSLRRHYGILRAILEGTTDAVFVKDPQGRYVMINPAGARFLGNPAEQVLGKDDTELFSPETARQIMEMDRQVLASGETRTYEGIGTAAGVTRTYLSTKGVCRDPQGNVVGLFGIARDISERKQAERRLAAEHAVARALAESTVLADAAPKILQTIGESLGWDVSGLWEVDRQARVLRCVEVWHSPAAEVPEFEQLSRRITFPVGVGLPGRVWARGEPAWVADVVADADCLRWPVARQEGLHGACGFPIRSGGEVLAVLEFFSRAARELDQALLDTMVSISSQISQFIERKRAERAWHERETEFDLARQIQQRLLPQAAPALADFAIGGASRPAHKAGGDYFDFLPIPDGHLGIAIGDASGHGLAAALLMAETRAYLRALALTHSDIRGILTLTNRRLSEDIGDDYFVTLFLARLNPVTRCLVYSNAGHCPGYIVDARGEVKAVLQSTGPPLGLDQASDFSAAHAIILGPDELVFLFTDGVVEAFSADGTPFGLERALDLVRAHRRQTPGEIVEALFRGVREFSGGIQADDMTAVIIKVGPPSESGASIGRYPGAA